MSGKPIEYVTDALGNRLEDYQRSLKKHGIATLLGTLQDLLDPKFLMALSSAGAVSGAVGGAEWAAAISATAVVGKTVVSVTQKYLDIDDSKRGLGSEVAFIHDVTKLAKD
jgi:hypothetical protein